MVVGPARIMPYHAGMSDVEYSPEAEAEALKQFSDAFNKLKHEGVGGEDLYNQTLPLWRKYESIRKQGELEGWIENRDAAMLGRGTKRRIAFALGVLFAFWTVQSFFRSDLPAAGRVALGVVALGCLYFGWRLGRIPYLGEEDKVD